MGKWGKWGKEERGIGEMGNEGPGARANEGMRTAARGKEGRGKGERGKGERGKETPPLRAPLFGRCVPAFRLFPWPLSFYLLASFAIF